MNFYIKKIVSICLILATINLFGYMPNQVQALQKALKIPGKIINCSGCDLRGVQELAGLDLHKAFMPGVSMQPCLSVSKNSPMVCIEKQSTNLTGVNLSLANISNASLDDVIFDKADLTGVDFSGSSLQYASLQDAIIKDCITTNATFCHAIMPDGAECKDSWSGQGLTIDCNCFDAVTLQPEPVVDVKAVQPQS